MKSIHLSDIRYIQSLGNYIKIFTTTETHFSLITTKQIEVDLPAQEFIRIHKSFIVNRVHIAYVTENEICVNNQLLPIGKTYKQYVNHLLKGSKNN